MPETRTHPSICRFCHAHCAILVDVEDGRAVRVLGDRENPIYHGYTCAKGRALPEQHYHPERTFDIKMSATAKLAHYAIAPRLSLEQPGMSLPAETLVPYAMGYGMPYAQYTPKILDPPAGSDVIEEWEFFYGLAQRMGLGLELQAAYSWGPELEKPATTALDMRRKPTTDELFELLTKGPRVPLDEVKRHPHGQVFEDPPARVEPKDRGCTAKLDLANPVMLGELAEVAGEPLARDAGFAFRVLCRRLLDVPNSAGRDIAKLTRKYRYNPAFMHPDDLRGSA